MKHIYGALVIAWIAVELVFKSNSNITAIASLLGALWLFIIKEKYIDNIYSSIIFLMVILILSQFYPDFIVLTGIVLFDSAYFKKRTLGIVVFIIIGVIYSTNYPLLFHLIYSLFLGYVLGEKDFNSKNNFELLDKERKLRYNLEQTQNQLIKSKVEIEELTKIRERNRIAHELHDNMGHSIAGVIFQLEAALRIINKDKEKAEGILKLCSKKLSEALELTRDTVYNMKVDKKLGVDSIKKIISDFKFCPVVFEHTGDFSNVSFFIIQIMESNIMEFLTNASKYSQATEIEIRIDINAKNLRLFYKDNGIGCENIKANVGITGIRDRVRAAGGTISVDGKVGFLIVCNLPVNNEKREEPF
ncbi:MAG: sensor histidine kinase [Clostridiaceae bacterium]|nr:sensor histidine kinase [Clostridiaceae bacterium]